MMQTPVYSDGEIDALLKANEWQSKMVAYRLAKRLPASVPIDDLIQAGRISAWRSIQSFNGHGEVGAHINSRLRWAMTDYLREIDPLSKGHRQEIKQRGLPPPTHVSASDFEADGLSVACESAEDTYARKQQLELCARAAERLSARKQYVIEQALVEGRTLTDIGAELGVTIARVSQMMTEATGAISRFMAAKHHHVVLRQVPSESAYDDWAAANVRW